MSRIDDQAMLAPMPLIRSGERDRYAAVCTVLRIAARLRADVTDVGVVCGALGLDLNELGLGLNAALKRGARQ